MSEELTPKACPHCGAERHPDPECGSFYSCNTVVRSPRERGRRCYAREINQLRTANAELLEALVGIEEIYTDGDDTYEDWKAMGEKARAAITKATAKPAQVEQ